MFIIICIFVIFIIFLIIFEFYNKNVFTFIIFKELTSKLLVQI